ncbi:MAG: hypothetical protein IJZ08_04855 [Clostridia bacterium]|nr:hypothetical protein [Clostridia bacterium]
MLWLICFSIALAVLLLSVGFALYPGKKPQWISDPLKPIFAGVIVSSFTLFLPLHTEVFPNVSDQLLATVERWVSIVFISIHNTIRLFIVDGDFAYIVEHTSTIDGWLHSSYLITFSLLFVIAPVLTFSFALSFFKNVSAHLKYGLCFRRDVYIFSVLNENSLALASSLVNEKNRKGVRRIIVFNDVFSKEDEHTSEQILQAKALGAICFKKDILSVNYALHSKARNLSFFLIGEDHNEQTEQALKLITAYKARKNTSLYVFSTQPEMESLLSSAYNAAADGKSAPQIKVRRINEVRLLISRTLYDSGYENLFCRAHDDGSDTKKITALVVGMGLHGTEMTKALSWFCQMDGYETEIHSFDLKKDADSAFESLCPELMDPVYNGHRGDTQDANYTIRIHPGYDITTKRFDDAALALPPVTYVFVCLGDDSMNISVALKLRALFAKNGMHPVIQAVVYNAERKNALADIKNFKGQAYDIDFIGDLKTSFSSDVILHSDVEEVALSRHLKWGQESDFWKYDYNYCSSIASAIHRKMKSLCGIPGIDKAPAERTEEELWNLRRLEHRRWNAYMRSEGYSYAPKRYDLAKVHHCLVPFDELSPEDQAKDDD